MRTIIKAADFLASQGIIAKLIENDHEQVIMVLCCPIESNGCGIEGYSNTIFINHYKKMWSIQGPRGCEQLFTKSVHKNFDDAYRRLQKLIDSLET